MRSPPATRVGAGGDKLPGPSNLLAALECAGGVPSERAFVVDDRRQKTLAVEPHGAGACIRAPDSDEARSCHRRRGKKTSLGRYVPCSVRIELISLPERLQRATRQRSPKSCRRNRHTEPNKSLLHISLWRRRRENRRGHPDRLDWVTNGHGVFRMTGSRFGMRPHSRAEAHQLEKFPTSFVGAGGLAAAVRTSSDFSCITRKIAAGVGSAFEAMPHGLSEATITRIAKKDGLSTTAKHATRQESPPVRSSDLRSTTVVWSSNFSQ